MTEIPVIEILAGVLWLVSIVLLWRKVELKNALFAYAIASVYVLVTVLAAYINDNDVNSAGMYSVVILVLSAIIIIAVAKYRMGVADNTTEGESQNYTREQLQAFLKNGVD